MRTLTLASLLLLAGCGSTASVRPTSTAAIPAPKAVEYLSAESCAKDWGLKFRWEAEVRRATVSGPDRELVCCAGMRSALLDGVPVRLEAPAELRAGRLMIPASLSTDAKRAWALRPAPPSVAEAPKALLLPVPSGPRVVVDAGHGGVLTGAQGVSGTWEKTVTLAIASRLAEDLKASGMDVTVLRDMDRDFFPASMANASYHEQQKSDLNERVRLANGARPDLFVSIHANWAPSPDAEGFEVYYPRAPLSEPPPVAMARGKARRKSPFDWSVYGSDTANVIRRMSGGDREEDRWKDSRDLAECVRHSLHAGLSTPDRGARQADHVVTRSSTAPAILVETGFLSNPDEERRLNSPEYQKRVAAAVAQGVKRFLAAHKP